jgi:hypothetical protein
VEYGENPVSLSPNVDGTKFSDPERDAERLVHDLERSYTKHDDDSEIVMSQLSNQDRPALHTADRKPPPIAVDVALDEFGKAARLDAESDDLQRLIEISTGRQQTSFGRIESSAREPPSTRRGRFSDHEDETTNPQTTLQKLAYAKGTRIAAHVVLS